MAKTNTNPEIPGERKIISIKINGVTKLLGSSDIQTELESDVIDTDTNAKAKIMDLIHEGYLPVFPTDKVESIDWISDEGIDPRKPLMQTLNEVIGTIGRLPSKGKSKFLVAVLHPEDIAKSLTPRFTGKKGKFIGALSPLQKVSKENLIILDPDTFEILHAPEGTKLEGIRGVIESVREEVKKAA